MLAANTIISGTHGEAWIDGEKYAETNGLQAKVTLNKEAVNICKQAIQGNKIMSRSGSGSITMHHVNTRLRKKIGDAIKSGDDPRFVIVSSLTDPASDGAERVQLTGVSFDEVTLANWSAGAIGSIEVPFTFDDFDWLDIIE